MWPRHNVTRYAQYSYKNYLIWVNNLYKKTQNKTKYNSEEKYCSKFPILSRFVDNESKVSKERIKRENIATLRDSFFYFTHKSKSYRSSDVFSSWNEELVHVLNETVSALYFTVTQKFRHLNNGKMSNLIIS